jgi:hypothetical protein
MELLPIPIEKINLPTIYRFWDKVDKKNKTEDDCWLWVGPRTGDNGTGYNRRCPIFKIGYTNYTATRIAYYIQTWVDPQDSLVLHDCRPNEDNNLCCNIKHLWLGNQSDNIKDCVNKGRRMKSFGYKLTHDQVRLMRKLYSEGYNTTELAKQFNIRREYAWRVVNYKVWTDI